MRDGSQGMDALSGNIPPRLARTVERLKAALAEVQVPLVLSVRENGTVAGCVSPSAQAQRLDLHSPVRVASNTKTFVAATVLRLWEEGRVGLDASLGELADPVIVELLANGGYDVDAITLRHLLNHSAGLWDHADERFVERVFADPTRQWSRVEQVKQCMDIGGPASAVGAAFRYSDTGYIILGDVIERVSGQPLAAAVREACGFDRLGLMSTWWEKQESPPQQARARAPQFYRGADIAGLDASMDLYGGGGLIMSPADLADAMAALFEGRVFSRAETMAEMLSMGAHEGAADYRLGVFVVGEAARRYYWHTGFWGTGVFHLPEQDFTVAGFVTARDDRAVLIDTIQAELRARL